METNYFPGLYQSSDSLSNFKQTTFFNVLLLQILSLLFASIASICGNLHWLIATVQFASLIVTLGCSFYLLHLQPEKTWYAARAVAESIKTLTWRFIARAQPFDCSDTEARSLFRNKLRQVVEQNREVCSRLNSNLEEVQITEEMIHARNLPFEARKNYYITNRITNQLEWYAKKSANNNKLYNRTFAILLSTNVISIILAGLRIAFIDNPYWPTDVSITAAACLTTWMQSKRFSELASSYSLAAHEISLIREQSASVTDEENFSDFVGDTENAFSREHTQWTARKDR